MDTLNAKNEIINQARAKLEDLFSTNSGKFARDLERIIGSGVYDVETIKLMMAELGWDREVTNALGQFDKLFDLSKKQFASSGVKFLWTAQNEALFEQFLIAKAESLVQLSKGKFAQDMFNYAISVNLSGKPSAQIISEAEQMWADLSRRIGTEVDTALATFDRTADKMLYENAGVEKFIYWGPVDERNRESCRLVLSDSRQQTGWTMEDIENFPEVDFNLGGYPYYNCRHKFIPMEFNTEGVQGDITEAGKEKWQK